MAKKIRFPLKINDTDVRSIEDLRENFDLETVLGYYTNGKLVTWLRDRYYNEEADTIEALSADDEQLGSKLAKALGVEIEADENLDIEEVRFRREKLEMLSRYISNRKILDNMDIVAVDQDDLYDILDSGADKVYLFKETFSVPTRRGDVTYIGLNGAKVKLQGKTDYDFDAVNIHFENVEFSLSDNSEELYHIAECYYRGNGVTQNYVEAFKLYTKAAAYDNSYAMNMLGECYCFGKGVDINRAEAFKWFTKAAEYDNSEAFYSLGKCYCFGYGVEVNVEEAAKWCTKSGKKNGNVFVADAYRNGFMSNLTFKEYRAESIKWYIKAYEQGCVEVAHEIAEIYDIDLDNLEEAIKWYIKSYEQISDNYAIDVADLYYRLENYIEAIKWYEIILNQGYESAKVDLGDCYYKIAEQYRKGHSEDRLVRAFENYKKAADYGHVHSIYQVGHSYACGFGVPRDDAEAFKWITIAAEKGDRFAQCNLGSYYRTGNFVEQNYEKAAEWYRKSAEQDYWAAYIAYGDCCYYGRGVVQDYKEAFEWYKKGSDASIGMIRLGDCYLYGHGVEQNYYEAEKWYLEAADYEEEAYVGLADCYSIDDSPIKDYIKAAEWIRKAADAGVEAPEGSRLSNAVYRMVAAGLNHAWFGD